MADRLDSLAAIDAAVWSELVAAVRDRGHAWRTPVLATVDATADGPVADARTVVVREVDVDRRVLTFYSDARAGKLRQLRAHPVGTLSAWSPALGWQFRARVRLEAETDGLSVSSRWTRLKLTPAAHDYLSVLPPGSPLADTWQGARGSRAHFAVVTAQVLSLDWTELHEAGHRRARFAPEGASWLQV